VEGTRWKEQGRRNKVEGTRRKRRYSTQSIRKGMVCTSWQGENEVEKNL